MSSEMTVSERVGWAIQRYQAAVNDFDREVARLLHVSELELRCLEIVLQSDEGTSPRELADQLGITTGSMTTMTDRLSARGYLSRTPHPSDGRKILVRATELLSTRAYTLIGPLLADGRENLLPQFTESELAAVERFMRAAAESQRQHAEALRSVVW